MVPSTFARQRVVHDSVACGLGAARRSWLAMPLHATKHRQNARPRARTVPVGDHGAREFHSLRRRRHWERPESAERRGRARRASPECESDESVSASSESGVRSSHADVDKSSGVRRSVATRVGSRHRRQVKAVSRRFTADYRPRRRPDLALALGARRSAARRSSPRATRHPRRAIGRHRPSGSARSGIRREIGNKKRKENISNYEE